MHWCGEQIPSMQCIGCGEQLTFGTSVQAGSKEQQPQRRHYLVQQERRQQQYCPWQQQLSRMDCSSSNSMDCSSSSKAVHSARCSLSQHMFACHMFIGVGRVECHLCTPVNSVLGLYMFFGHMLERVIC
jgi:hypothetical protein